MEIKLLKEIIEFQNRAFGKEISYIKRDSLEYVKRFLKMPHAILITGLRRAGKSTLLKEIKDEYFKNALVYYFNFDNENLMDFNVADFNKLYEAFVEMYGKSKIFFFDEIQSVKGWELFVRRMYDSGFKFIITGSNSALMSRELGTKLTGRNIPLELFPFSFKEFLDFKMSEFSYQSATGGKLRLFSTLNSKKILSTKNHRAVGIDGKSHQSLTGGSLEIKKYNIYLAEDRALIKKAFSEYLEKGGIPEYLIYKDDYLIKVLYENILYKDILARYGLQNEKSLRELSAYLFSNYGNEISYNHLKSMLNLGSLNTVKNYIQYLESSYLIFTISKYDPSIKKQIYSRKKSYVIDSGIINLISMKFSRNSGKLLENTVFMELKRRKKEIYYHKDKYECDFVIRNFNLITEAIQVTETLEENNKEREFNGLLEVMKKYKLKEGLILTDDSEGEERINGKKIMIKSVWKWLLE